MAELCNLKVGAKVASWPYFGHIFWIMDFKFVLPTIHINIKGEAQLEVKWTILSSKMDKSDHISIRVFA